MVTQKSWVWFSTRSIERYTREYGRCVDIVTVGALKQMVLPGLVVVVVPVLVGAILKAEAAVGYGG